MVAKIVSESHTEGILNGIVSLALSWWRWAIGTPVVSTSPAVEMESKLERWKTQGVSKSTVQQIASKEATACVVAFLLNYESERDETFRKLNGSMRQVFEKKFIYGASFVDADEEEKKVLIDVLAVALADVVDEDALTLTKMRVKKFIQLASR